MVFVDAYVTPGVFSQSLSFLPPNTAALTQSCYLAAQQISAVTVNNNCPWTLTYAASDTRFQYYTSKSINGYNLTCYVETSWSSYRSLQNSSNKTIAAKQQCCYFNNNGALTTKTPFAGLATTNQTGEAAFVLNCAPSYAVQFLPAATSINYVPLVTATGELLT
jgi:hypothetical protein